MTTIATSSRRIEPCACGTDKRGFVHGFVWVDDRPWAMYLATFGGTVRRPRIDLALGVYVGGTLGLTVTRERSTLFVGHLEDSAPVDVLGGRMDEQEARSLAPGLVDTVRAIVCCDRRLRMHVFDPRLELVVLDAAYDAG